MWLFLILIGGFFALIYGASLLVDSASSLAKQFNIPNIVIGLTIVSFGTSAPELIINSFASAQGDTAIALGNVVGSNIFNVLAILGISSIIYPLSVKTNTTWIEIPLSLLAATILLVIANDQLIERASASAVTRTDGIMLLFFFLIFMVYNFQLMKSGTGDDEVTIKNYTTTKSVLLLLLGLALLVAGGRGIVYSAVAIAEKFGISERIIALTIISIGTSLPELATSAVAAYKKQADIAIGNVVGSNIFNVFLVLGVSAVIHPVPLQEGTNLDLIVHLTSCMLLFLFIFTGKRHKIDRWEGILFTSMYVAYVVALIVMA
jgi:cation:H+ antiporter